MTEQDAITIIDWLQNQGLYVPYSMYALFIGSAASDLGIPILERLLQAYKVTKLKNNLVCIEEVFDNLRGVDLVRGCELLSHSTPTIVAGLLRRNNIPEQYVEGALKALSRLREQKKIAYELSPSSLQCLNPFSRLNVMKQLFGMFDVYYVMMKYLEGRPEDKEYYDYYKEQHDKHRIQKDFPFKGGLAQDEIEGLLFPCLIQYNEEVCMIMERYRELVSKQQTKESK